MQSNRYFFVNVFLLKELLTANKEGQPMFGTGKDAATRIPVYVLPLLLWMLSMQQRKKEIYISAETWSKWTGLRLTTVYSAFKWLNQYGFRTTERVVKRTSDGENRVSTRAVFNVDPLRNWLNRRIANDAELKSIIIDSYQNEEKKKLPENSVRGLNICISLEAMKAFRRKTGQKRGRTVSTNFLAFLIWSWALTKAAVDETDSGYISIRLSALQQIFCVNYGPVKAAMAWLEKEHLLVPEPTAGPKVYQVNMSEKLLNKMEAIRASIKKGNAYSVVQTVQTTVPADDGKNFDDTPELITLNT